MKKWILIGGGVGAVILLVLLAIGLSNLGPLINNAVNLYGPEITGTDLHLGNVSVSVFSGEAELTDFSLGNPAGFKTPQAMKVKSIAVNIDQGSLTKDTIILEKIEVIGPEITYEKSKGTDNFKVILENVKERVGGKAPSKADRREKGKEGQGAEGKKLLIRNLIVKGGKVNLAMTMLDGRGISAPLPDIHLREIEKREGGASAPEAFEAVFAALYSEITSAAVTDTLNQGLKELGSSLNGVTGDARKQIQDAGAEVQKEAEALTGRVKGLFKR